MDRIAAAVRNLSVAFGLTGILISATGSVANRAVTEGELGSNHGLADEKRPTPSHESTPLTPSDSATAATTLTASSIESAWQAGRAFLPATLERFAATFSLDSSVFDVLPGERKLTPVGFGAKRPRPSGQASLFFLNYPFEKRPGASFTHFAPGAIRERAETYVSRGSSFELQTRSEFRSAPMPDFFQWVSTSTFATNSPGQPAAPYTTAHENEIFGPPSPDKHVPTWGAHPNPGFEKRDWNVPARAAAAGYALATSTVAATPESGSGSEPFRRLDSPALALSSGNPANNLTFGLNGARLSGNGTLAGDIVLDPSLGIAPGNSPGLLTIAGGLTWSQGGFFELEVQDTAGAPGTGWDAIQVNGILQFTATIGDPFVIHLSSLTDSGASGNISNFLATRPYALQVLTATGGINGFNPAAVRITTTGFTNALDGGSFALLATGDELMLTFTPVPEPSTWALMLTGASVLAVKLMRRRRRA